MNLGRRNANDGGDLAKRAAIIEESYRRHRGGNALSMLIGFYRGYYHNFLLSALFFAIKHSPVWFLPIATANIINDVTAGVPLADLHINVYGIILAVLLVLNIPMNYLHQHFRSQAIRGVEAGLRSSLVHKIQKLSIPYHRETESGRLQSKIIRDVEAVEGLSSQLFVGVLNIAINMAVALSVTVAKSRIVFLFFLLMAPIAAFLVVTFRKPIKERNRLFRKELENTGARVNEMVQLVPVTRAHALEEEESRRMDAYLHRVAAQGYALDIVQANFGAVSWVSFQLFQVLCLVFTAHLALRGQIATGDVVLYQSYFATIVSQVSSIMNLLPTIAKGLESVTSIGEVLLEEDIEQDEGKEKIDVLTGEYRFDHVSYRYPKTAAPVVKDFSLTVRPRECIAFVGESGAGKSTVINMIVGFCRPTEGTLFVDGRDIKAIDLHTYREHLAVVPQETILFSGTIRDNILYGTKDVSEERLRQVIEEAGLLPVIDKLPDGMETKVGEHGDKLSGGQKQRISIVRALIRDPSVIILDEATSALDAISEREVTEALNRVSASRTTFIVAHKLETVQRADRIVVMRDGAVVECGNWQELMDQKGYFYRLQISGGAPE